MSEAVVAEEDKKKFRERYNVDEIQTLRDEMVKEAGFRYVNTTPVGEKFEEVVDALRYPMPSSVVRDVVYDSVQDLAGVKLTKWLLWTTAFRLAGNLPRLRRNTPVPAWSVQRDIEWVPAQVVSAKRRRSLGRAKKPGYLFTFQLLAGTACPLKITKFWSDGFCWKLVREELGFSKRNRPNRSGDPIPHMFQNPQEIVNMRMLVLLDPAESTHTQPGFDKIDISPSLLKHNHKLMDLRDRLKPGCECPHNFDPDTVPCCRCYAGYLTCPAGTHRLDYTFDYCSGCGRGQMPFNYDLSNSICLHCFDKRQMERKD